VFKRARRLRQNTNLRELVEETSIDTKDFIYPLFIKDGIDKKIEISSMPDVFQMSIKDATKECIELKELGIYHIILFGIPSTKDCLGSEALEENSIIARAIKAIKKEHPEMTITTDLCFCEYTDHGHCGILDDQKKSVDNDKTLKALQQQAIIHAKAGADMIAPSGMMDGVVKALRDALDKSNFYNLPIMSYSTKFASNYYGPFRDVAEGAPSFGDRKSYQMNPANINEAIAESLQDEIEGADILMVKPALAYLDVVREIKNHSRLPIAIYNVSGEYAMLKLAGKNGLLDYDKVLLETMIAFKRAGASIIISYHAKEVARLLK
jgi:porphobilinogen synthase